MYPYILQGESLTIVIENKQHSINKTTHPNYSRILDAIVEGDWDSIPDLVDMTRAIVNYLSDNGDIEVKDGDVYYQGRPFHNAITDRLIAMLEEGFPVEPLVNFLGNLKLNPSKRAVDELYGFLEKNSLPITPDGHFLAYKRVRGNYSDIHSGTFDNSVGNVCEMPRNEVNEDKDQTCSTGLHFCSLEYLPSFGGYGNDNRVVILKINPRDVVSIPSDYNNAKGRTCRYEVVADKDAATSDKEEAFDTVVVGDFDDDFTGFEDFLEDFENTSSAPREVYLDADNRARYSDDGRYAPLQALSEYEDYLDQVEEDADDEEWPASFDYAEVREVVETPGGRYQYTDSGQFAPKAAYVAWNLYLKEGGE